MLIINDKVEISIKITISDESYDIINNLSRMEDVSSKRVVNEFIKYIYKEKFINSKSINGAFTINAHMKIITVKISSECYEYITMMGGMMGTNKKDTLGLLIRCGISEFNDICISQGRVLHLN